MILSILYTASPKLLQVVIWLEKAAILYYYYFTVCIVLKSNQVKNSLLAAEGQVPFELIARKIQEFYSNSHLSHGHNIAFKQC